MVDAWQETAGGVIAIVCLCDRDVMVRLVGYEGAVIRPW